MWSHEIKKYNLLFLLLSLLLTSCGFRPQGEMHLAPALHRLYLQTPDPYGSLARSLHDYFKMSHVIVVPSREEAETVLAILQDSTSQELLSVSSTQQSRQYNLIVTVVFEITDSHGKTLLGPQTLTEKQTITIQSNQILGSSNEANLYYYQMRRAIAHAIMRRLASRQVTQLLMNDFSMSKTP